MSAIDRPIQLHSADKLLHDSRRLPITVNMSGKAGAYGASGAGGDTDFRKTWDREDMAKKAKERETKEREEAKERYEARPTGGARRRQKICGRQRPAQSA